MNIFYLDESAWLAAEYQVDKHVSKMPTESAQILCTALNVLNGKQITPYKTTHINHPSCLWAREKVDNWIWLYYLMQNLNNEWKYRFNHERNHGAYQKMIDANLWDLAHKTFGNMPEFIEITPLKLAIKDYCKISDDPVINYREFYNREKRHLFKWTKRDIPEWIELE